MKQSRTNIRLSFTPQEMEILSKRAARVGMTIPPFIKREALYGIVRGFQLRPLTDHAIAIGEIVQDIRTMITSPHPDRWLYEYDLECIEDKLNTLLEIETDIQKRVRRRPG